MVDIKRLIEMIVNMVKHACEPRFIPGPTSGFIHDGAERNSENQKYHVPVYQILRS